MKKVNINYNNGILMDLLKKKPGGQVEDWDGGFLSSFFSPEEKALLEKYKIPAGKLILCGREILYCLAENSAEEYILMENILSGKNIFIYGLSEDKGTINIGKPESVYIEIIGQPKNPFARLPLRKIKKSGKAVKDGKAEARPSEEAEKIISRLKVLMFGDCIKPALSERMFFARYNAEIYYKNVLLEGRILTQQQIQEIYSDAARNRFLSAEEKPVQTALLTAYTIAVKNASLRDIYSTDSIFNKEKADVESMRTLAASEFLEIVYKRDYNMLSYAVEQICDTFMRMVLPPLVIDDCVTLRENYTLYAALSNIGAAFIKMTSGCEKTEKHLKKAIGKKYTNALIIAHCFLKYRLAVNLCDSTVTGNYSENEGNEEVFDFVSRIHSLNMPELRGGDLLEL